LWSRRAGVRVPSVTPQVAERVAEVITGVITALTRPAATVRSPGWSLDVEDGGTDAADSNDDTFSSVGCDRLSVDQVRGNVDEVPLADLDQLGAQARTRPSARRW
jgi:hypothetical protein